MIAAPARDFEPWEVGSAIIIAIAIQLGAGVLLSIASDKNAPMNEVDKGDQVPVRVIPVLDTEMITARAGGKQSKLPDMWQRAPQSVKKAVQETPPPPDVVAPSPNADLSPTAIPDKDKPVTSVEDAGKEEDDAKQEDLPDSGLENGDPDAAVATLDEDGGTNNAAGPGCQGEGCTPDGGLDNFQKAQYNGRLASFFRRGFVVSGLGLPPEEIKKLSVSVSVQLSGLSVTGFTMSSSGNSTFDSAARSAIQGKVGSQVPPPPEDHPEWEVPSISFTMTCGSACN